MTSPLYSRYPGYSTTFSLLFLQLTLFSNSHHCFEQGGPEGGLQEVRGGEVAEDVGQQLDFKLAEVAVYARDTDFLLAWTGVMKNRSEVRRMFHLPEKSVEDHILAGWCGRIGEMKKMVKMK